MGLANSIFQKDIYDLTIEDIIKFFSVDQEEGSLIEFKSGEVSLEAIYREVSAFLNTEGGILIIGSPKETRNGNQKKICKGELIPSKISNQDSLMQKISSNIVPSPYKIKIKELDYFEGKIYIIEIPQSFNPPHQISNEGKYYIRLEREAKAAPHGIVEALFNKRQKPNLDVEINAYVNNEEPKQIELKFEFINDSLISAEHVGYLLEIHGIKQIEKNKNLHNKLMLENEKLSYQDTFERDIIVKNITIPIQLFIMPLYDYLYAQCTYYCKDVAAETKAGILEFSNEIKTLKSFNSKSDKNEMTPFEMLRYYEKLKNGGLYFRLLRKTH